MLFKKLKYVVAALFLVFLCSSIETNAARQDSLLPVELVKKEMNLFSQSPQKDSIFYSLIGYFREKRKRFSKVVENRVYFDERGFFYRIDLADDRGNITVSATFFKPHIIAKNQSADTISEINEHICVCSAVIGYTKIIKKGRNFVCADGVKEQDAENYSIDCEQFNSLQWLIDTYYDKGFAAKNKFEIIPVEILYIDD